jgi:hypothetical protein
LVEPEFGFGHGHAVDSALKNQSRGLRIRSSLAKLLCKHRGVGRHVRKPRLSARQILAWADEFRLNEGRWPEVHSGTIDESGGDTWQSVHRALQQGRRGLPKTASLASFLVEHRDARNTHALPSLSVQQILCWADEYKLNHDAWPTRESGAIPGSRGETWSSVNYALARGCRGLDGGSSLAKLLAERRGRRNKGDLARIAETGASPRVTSGAVQNATGESWRQIDDARRQGYRGLPGGSSLHQLLKKRKLIPSAS